MTGCPDGNAIVYCQGAFNTTNGKTAHGLVRRTRRYRVLSVVDSRYDGQDAGEVLDGQARNIPIYGSVTAAVEAARAQEQKPTHLVVGLAPDGGRLSPQARQDIICGIRLGLHVDSGLHDFLSDRQYIAHLASEFGVCIRDIRKPPPRSHLHFFSGKIETVRCLKVAMLGTDSAVGKRTTAWTIVEGFERLGHEAELVGTGQTAWLQGARYCIIMDSLVNDFVSGEIEHAVWGAWNRHRPEVIVLEGQGSLMNPAYPGGFELLAAGRPDVVVLQHAPARRDYDGFPGYRIHPLKQQIQAIELISGKPVVAVTVNHEGLDQSDVPGACSRIKAETGLPAWDVLLDGADGLCALLAKYLPGDGPGRHEAGACRALV